MNTTICRFRLPVVSGLATVLVAFSVSSFCHESEEKSPVPGFRPESEHAAAFLDSVSDARIAVLPTMVRRVNRTAHSFASQRQIVAFLNDSKITTAVAKPRRIDLGPLRRPSQWDIFRYGARSVAENLEGYETGADYILVMEFLVPDDQSVFGIETYIVDLQGRNAFSFLLNSHHEMFSDATLVARNSSEDERSKMIENATRVGLLALKAQIERASQPDVAVTHRAFVETRIDEGSSRIIVEPRRFEGLAVEKAMTLSCECAKLTTDRGFRYFRIDERAQLPDGRSSFRIHFYDTPPEGVPVASTSIGSERKEVPDLMEAAIDAYEFVKVCTMLTNPPEAPQEP